MLDRVVCFLSVHDQLHRYEQREALLEEAEALRRAQELVGMGENAKKGKWRARAEELGREVAAARATATEHQRLAETLQLQLTVATEEVSDADSITAHPCQASTTPMSAF